MALYNDILGAIADDQHTTASDLGYQTTAQAAEAIAKDILALVKAELADPKYAKFTDQEIADALNSVQPVVTTSTEPSPFAFSDLFALLTSAEQNAIISDSVFGTFESISDTGDIPRIASLVNILKMTSKIGQASHDAIVARVKQTRQIANTTYKIPRFTEVTLGKPYVPNLISAALVAEALAS